MNSAIPTKCRLGEVVIAIGNPVSLFGHGHRGIVSGAQTANQSGPMTATSRGGEKPPRSGDQQERHFRRSLFQCSMGEVIGRSKTPLIIRRRAGSSGIGLAVPPSGGWVVDQLRQFGELAAAGLAVPHPAGHDESQNALTSAQRGRPGSPASRTRVRRRPGARTRPMSSSSSTART